MSEPHRLYWPDVERVMRKAVTVGGLNEAEGLILLRAYRKEPLEYVLRHKRVKKEEAAKIRMQR